MGLKKIALTIGVGLCLFVLTTSTAFAARLSLGPSAGSFTVGSVFEVSILLDTEGESINAFNVLLNFQPDKLQLISPSTGKSIVQVWTGPPQFNNRTGTVRLQGGIPNGINVSKGLISSFSFRVKRVGTALVKFSDESRVLLNNGKGTDVLKDVQNGIYELVLPPPAGPVVASETHPDQSRWYPNSTVILRWAGDRAVSDYSYVLNDEPVSVSDHISEGSNNSVAYKNTANGTRYFHIKALRDGVWGGVTHFALNVDAEPPADFSINISPSSRTISKSPIILFETTDADSGVDYYELKTVPLNPSAERDEESAPLFIEVDSRYILSLDTGSYDIIVRAYDKAGNYREVIERLDIIIPLFQVVSGEGVRVGDIVTVPWAWSLIIAGLIIVLLGYGGFKVREWHHATIRRSVRGELPAKVGDKLKELQKYRQKYGKLAIFLVLVSSFMFANGANAQQVELAPPFISTISREISNEEIFYIGGKADARDVDVIIYLQNLQSGETLSQVVTSGKNNEWFYRHNTFLPTGKYLLWTQTRIGKKFSPPSPQIQMSVRSTAIQFGASRLSFETLYLVISILFLLAIAGLSTFIVFHAYHGRRKHKELLREVREAEESVRRGFAVLRRDIQAELAVIKKVKLSKAISIEAQEKEKQLLKDLEWAERYIGKEIWDVEKEIK